ncbi:hypothetical protein FACS1894139_05390 [Planctomycetales bacterium]|nr:hypothetical protein FACS1894107_16060 [Planctomycetales bacterium]GHT00288.1 hypothetical protein FACS1894108_12000 [Planctomycetales bacterium]GHT03984.1 hypothetical protein FACS1894139_05390 [Planctomycetales bacterium]
MIQSFEFTHELAWNLLKDYLAAKGFTDLHGSRDATRAAFREGYIDDGELWMQMIESRNLSSHTYDSTTAQAVAARILERYIFAFRKLQARMSDCRAEDGQ